jgi:F-type H+-transporting ATPase subunit b
MLISGCTRINLQGVKGVIDINNSLIIQAILLITLMLLLNKILFQPVLRFLAKRQAKIQGDEEEATRLQEEAERRRLEIEEGLDKGRLRAVEEKGDIREAGVEEGKLMLETVQRELDEEIPEIKAQIEVESKRVLAELKKRRGDMAKEIAEKILGRSLR